MAHTEVSSCVSQITYSTSKQLRIKVTLLCLSTAALKCCCCIMWRLLNVSQCTGRHLLNMMYQSCVHLPGRVCSIPPSSASVLPNIHYKQHVYIYIYTYKCDKIFDCVHLHNKTHTTAEIFTL